MLSNIVKNQDDISDTVSLFQLLSKISLVISDFLQSVIYIFYLHFLLILCFFFVISSKLPWSKEKNNYQNESIRSKLGIEIHFARSFVWNWSIKKRQYVANSLSPSHFQKSTEIHLTISPIYFWICIIFH